MAAAINIDETSCDAVALIEPTKDPVELMKLDNYCLQEVLERLTTAHDLNAIASTCRRLQNIAQKVFKLNDSFKNLNVLQLLLENGSKSSTYMHEYLNNFGNLVVEITIKLNWWYHLNYYQPKMFDDIAVHCGATLKALCLEAVSLTSDQIKGAKSLFAQLAKLELISCENVDEILNVCGDLVELYIDHVKPIDYSKCNLPKLQKYTIHGCERSDGKDVEQFLQRHTHLKHFEIFGFTVFDLNVIRKLSDLETLIIQGEEGERCLGSRGIDFQWPQLKKLKLGLQTIDFPFCPYPGKFFDQMATINNLEYLELDLFDLNKKLARISQFKQLNVLKLTIWQRREQLNMNLFEHFKSLTNVVELGLKFDSIYSFDNNDYANEIIAKVLQHLGSARILEKLVIDVQVHDCFIDAAAIKAISQCTNLRHIDYKFCYEFDDGNQFDNISDMQWGVLKNLNKLESFEMIYYGDIYLKCLTSIGARDTLKSLIFPSKLSNSIHIARVTFDQIMETLQLFPNLSKLELGCFHLSDSECNALPTYCAQVKELSLMWSDWDGVNILISKLDKLQTIKLFMIKGPRLNIDIYNILIKTCRRCRKNQKLVLELSSLNAMVDLDCVDIRKHSDLLELRDV